MLSFFLLLKPAQVCIGQKWFYHSVSKWQHFTRNLNRRIYNMYCVRHLSLTYFVNVKTLSRTRCFRWGHKVLPYRALLKPLTYNNGSISKCLLVRAFWPLTVFSPVLRCDKGTYHLNDTHWLLFSEDNLVMNTQNIQKCFFTNFTFVIHWQPI